MAETELSEAAKQRLEMEREAATRSREEFAARMKGKPTPTQAENDEAAHGKFFEKHEEDGSDPDPGQQQRALEANRTGGYQTRQATPKPPPKPAA